MIDKAQNWGVTSQEEREAWVRQRARRGMFRVTSCQFTLIIIKYTSLAHYKLDCMDCGYKIVSVSVFPERTRLGLLNMKPRAIKPGLLRPANFISNSSLWSEYSSQYFWMTSIAGQLEPNSSAIQDSLELDGFA